MKSFNQKKFVLSLILIVVIALAGFIVYLNLGDKSSEGVAVYKETENSNTLTLVEAKALVLEKWGGCTPDLCSEVFVSIGQKDKIWYVTATYEGLRDDSVSAQRKVAPITYSNNKWSLGIPEVTQRCAKNRGHQNFNKEFCI